MRVQYSNIQYTCDLLEGKISVPIKKHIYKMLLLQTNKKKHFFWLSKILKAIILFLNNFFTICDLWYTCCDNESIFTLTN